MDSSPSGFTVSSGRRPPPVRSGCLVAVGVLVIVAAVAIFELSRSGEQPEQPARSPTQIPLMAPPPTATAAPTELVEFASQWVVAATTATPTPWIPSPPGPPQRREPTPTPSAASCISASYDAGQSLAAWGNVLVSIRATNRCRRVLQPTDVLFRVSGWRNGELVQTAQGSPFEEIWPGRSTDFGIGLPGSIDWYDRITVEVLD